MATFGVMRRGPSQPTRAVGSGYSRGGDTRRIAITFDTETFDQIRIHAIHKNISFSAAVRDLVEWGLDDVGRSR